MKKAITHLPGLALGAICVVAGVSAYLLLPPPRPARAEGAVFNTVTGQRSVTSAATMIANVRPGRYNIIIEQLSANADLYCGSPATLGVAVTTANGMLLPGVKGANLALNTSARVDCISVGATAAVSYAENF